MAFQRTGIRDESGTRDHRAHAHRGADARIARATLAVIVAVAGLSAPAAAETA